MNNWRGLVTDADVIANGLANFQNNIIAMDLTTVWVAPYAGVAVAAENAATSTFLTTASRTNTIVTTPCDVLVNAWNFLNPDYRPNGAGSGGALAGADLTPGIQIQSQSFTSNQTSEFVVDVFENSVGNSNGTITVSIPVPGGYTITVPTIATLSATPQTGANGSFTALGVPYNNGDWVFSLSLGNVIATSKLGIVITQANLSSLGFTIKRNIGAPAGTATLAATVSGGTDNTPENNLTLIGLSGL